MTSYHNHAKNNHGHCWRIARILLLVRTVDSFNDSSLFRHKAFNIRLEVCPEQWYGVRRFGLQKYLREGSYPLCSIYSMYSGVRGTNQAKKLRVGDVAIAIFIRQSNDTLDNVRRNAVIVMAKLATEVVDGQPAISITIEL